MENYDDLFAAQAEQQGDASFDKDAWAARKQTERESVYEMIDRYAADMSVDGGLFQAYLDVQARFDRYSVSNAILIATQCPEATRLADFDHWKESGVYVRWGAEAIIILEPGREYTRQKDGSTGVFYNPKKVFDISQTNSRQQAAPKVNRDGRLLLKALMNNAPCRFTVSNELPNEANAAYYDKENTIRVRKGLDASTIFQELAEELAYVHLTKGNYPCKRPSFVVYCVSYMLCQRYGVPVNRFSFAKMPEEYSRLDAQAIRGEAGVIREIAGVISADMNRLFSAHEKAQSTAARPASVDSRQTGKDTRSAAPPSPSPAEPASQGPSGTRKRAGGAR